MLSIETVNLLNSGCKCSDILYPQGGLIYLYKFGYKQAHIFIDRNILIKTKSMKWFDNSEIKIIETFFEKALVNSFSDTISTKTKDFTNQLLVNLKKDFSKMYYYIGFLENRSSIYNTLILTFVKNNSFHSLTLFWSVD